MKEWVKMNTETVEKKLPVEKQIEELLSIITSFSTLLEKETAAIKSSNFQEMNELQENKKFHAVRYEEKIKALSERREDILAVDIQIREKLQKERTKFNNILEKNKKALSNAQESTRRLANFILDTARKTIIEENKTNYSLTGKAQTFKSATNSLSVDQSL